MDIEKLEDMEDALRMLESILEDAADWGSGELTENLESAIDALNETIADTREEEEEGDY